MSMSKLIRLDEYCSSVRDGTHDTPKPTDSGFYLVTSKAINNNSIDLSCCYFIAEKDYKKINERSKVDKWDIIMTMIGTVGRLHLVNNDPEYAIKNIALFKVGNEERAKWLYYYLSTSTVQNYFELVASGTSQHFIGLGHLRKFKVENYTQNSKRITDILSAYDNLIEVNNKRIKVLEQMAENLYKEWFGRFRFPGYETAEFENGIPKGWEYCTVESLSSILQRGISPDYDEEGELTVISQKCIRKNIMDIREARKQRKTFKPELNLIDGDTVICSTGTGTLGRVGQIYGSYPNTTFDSHVTLVRAKEPIGKHYLYWTLKQMQPWFMSMGIGSTNQQELYRGTIKNAKALRPDNNLMARFEEIIEPIHREIIILNVSVENLIKQRDLLLPRLMSGKLEV